MATREQLEAMDRVIQNFDAKELWNEILSGRFNLPTSHTVSRTFRRDGITRIAVLEPERIEIIKVTDLEGREMQWLPRNN